MIAEIISIGTELILGDVIDSNSAYIAEQLTRYGYDIHYISTVGDNKKRLIKVIERAIIRADIIITTGGLGPTTDDITREAIAESTGCSLQKNTKLLENIKDYFHHKNYKMTINNERQAYLPEGAKALTNNFGTAPGFILKKDEYKIISLPGVPREMKGILENEVKPILLQDNENIIKSKTLNFFRIGESTLENKIDDIINNQNNPTIALLAGKGEVKIRITAKGCNQHKVDTLINTVEEKIRNRVGKYIYTVNDKKLEKVIGDLLNEKDMTLAVAESCTGGLIGRRITDIPGSSKYFLGGMIVYSNKAKIKQLNVNKKTIKKHGAVSRKTAAEMADNIRNIMNSDISLSITGIAGPGGGSKEKPVGLIYLGLAADSGNKVYRLNLNGDREWNRWMTSQYALYYLYKKLTKCRK